MNFLKKEDIKNYKEKKHEGFFEKCCEYEIIGEKQTLNLLKEICEFGIKILGMESMWKARDYYEKIEKKPEFDDYIENEILQIYWE